MCTYPAGVDDDDDVEESLHFGVLPLVGVWLEGVLGAAASGELFTEGDVDEGAPRYLGGKHIFRQCFCFPRNHNDGHDADSKTD